MSSVEQGFAPIFSECATRARAADYSRFRIDPAFWFMVPIGDQRLGPDYEALGRAAAFNVDRCAQYMKRPKSRLGYADERAYQRCDAIDSHHIMSSTFIFGTRAWAPDISVIEIGGGFGNWVRLNHSITPYRLWTIIDLPFVSRLQRWYIEQEVGPLSEIDVELVDTDQYGEWKKTFQGADLVIGSHSLSELDWDTFREYFEAVVLKAPTLFYATQRDNPSRELVIRKLDLIREHFVPEHHFSTEGGRVTNVLFRRK
jgi:hypothetical protein